ncbi:MAG: molybdopterin-guanine dinucleotide biosynthesis protein MobB, partial [Lachnospiraceae bacterium]|nr:molybdopterin-guanine dinucleotide biosynthesis protein MobB [Lachnospiraceae bacterium]
MGKNKALLKIENESILQRTTRELGGFSEILISAAKRGEYEALGFPVVYDEHPDVGPMEGIRMLVGEAAEEYVFVCACDMPFLKKELVEYLAEFISSDYDCYVIVDEQHIQPLCAIYSKAVLPVIEQLIAEGRYRLREIFDRVRTKYVSLALSCFDSKVVKNINTREEYRALSGPVVFCVSGYSDSGKTGLITKLINEFIREGYSVAVLKHDGHDTFSDLPGSDTDLFSKAGAVCSAIFTDTRHML